MPNYQGIEDDRLPSVVKPSLQQYDNYQIHDFYCSDPVTRTFAPSDSMKGKHWVAVEVVSPFGNIPINFEDIAIKYP